MGENLLSSCKEQSLEEQKKIYDWHGFQEFDEVYESSYPQADPSCDLEQFSFTSEPAGSETVITFRGSRLTLNKFLDVVEKMEFAEKLNFAVRYPGFWFWYHMMKSCYHPGYSAYPYVGGKGITVCEDWRDHERFYNWIHESLERHPITGRDVTFVRIDVQGNFCPENCYFGSWEFAPSRHI